MPTDVRKINWSELQNHPLVDMDPSGGTRLIKVKPSEGDQNYREALAFVNGLRLVAEQLDCVVAVAPYPTTVSHVDGSTTEWCEGFWVFE